MLQPFYDPGKTFEENFNEGPFGAFADGVAFVPGSGVPRYELFGKKIYSPFGIGPGPLGNSRFLIAALDKGFDIVMQKTVRTRIKPVHPFPNILPVKIEGDLKLNGGKIVTRETYEEPLSITNSFGNASFGPEFWQGDIKLAVKHAKKGQIVCASFEGTKWSGYGEEEYVNDWVLAAKLVKETGVGFMEANLSCPNEGTAQFLCYDVNKVEKIVRAIKKEINSFPLVLKISYFEKQKELEELVKRVGDMVDGFSAINTIPVEVIDTEGQQALPGEGRKISGVGGASIKWAGLDMVKRLKKLREEFGYPYVIFGIGGVMNPEDFFEYREAGADIVMSATGVMWNPYLAKEIKERLI